MDKVQSIAVEPADGSRRSPDGSPDGNPGNGGERKNGAVNFASNKKQAGAPATDSDTAARQPIIVSKGLTVGYKLHRERKRLTALRDITLSVNRD